MFVFSGLERPLNTIWAQRGNLMLVSSPAGQSKQFHPASKLSRFRYCPPPHCGVGCNVGNGEGCEEGDGEGRTEGSVVGIIVGTAEGDEVGCGVG